MSNSTQNDHETHTACIDRINIRGAGATCCYCEPHEGCTLGMKNSTQNDCDCCKCFCKECGEKCYRSPCKVHSTQNDSLKKRTFFYTEDELRFYLVNLAVAIGTQVSNDYKENRGIYEGLSIKNVKLVDQYTKLFVELLADARREAIDEAIDLIKRLKLTKLPYDEIYELFTLKEEQV